MKECHCVVDAHDYARRSGAALVVTDGDTSTVYERPEDVPANLRPKNPKEEPIYE